MYRCQSVKLFIEDRPLIHLHPSFCVIMEANFPSGLQGDTRMVQQFHFTGWPDKNAPQFATSLLDFRRKVRLHIDKRTGPVVVHCRYVIRHVSRKKKGRPYTCYFIFTLKRHFCYLVCESLQCWCRKNGNLHCHRLFTNADE